MAKIQERAEKKKVGDQTAGKLSAAEIVKALQEHIASIVTPEKAGSTEDELAAELAANQAQIVLKLGPERKRDRKIQIFASKLADGQVIYHVVDLRGASQDFKPVFIDIQHVPRSNIAVHQSSAAAIKEPLQRLPPEDGAMSIDDPGLQHALKFSERLRAGESRVFSPEETKASWTESDRQIAELQSLVAEKFGGLKR
jgi:hypothetical protein